MSIDNYSPLADLEDGYSQIFMRIAIGCGLLIYAAALVYAGYESLVLMLSGVKGEGVIFATVGLVALELNCAALPLAIHFWTKEPAHKTAACIFYILSFGLSITNVIVSFNRQAGKNGSMPGWVEMYAQWVLPITPILCGIAWAILFMLDPSNRARAMEHRIKAASVMAYLNARKKQAISNAQYRAMVEAAAERDQLASGDRMFGNQTYALPAPAPAQPTPRPTQGKEVEQRHPLPAPARKPGAPAAKSRKLPDLHWLKAPKIKPMQIPQETSSQVASAQPQPAKAVNYPKIKSYGKTYSPAAADGASDQEELE